MFYTAVHPENVFLRDHEIQGKIYLIQQYIVKKKTTKPKTKQLRDETKNILEVVCARGNAWVSKASETREFI